MILTTEWQMVGQTYVGNTGHGDVYLRGYARYSTQDYANNRSYVYYETRLYLSVGTFYAGSTTTAGIGSNLGQSWGNNKTGSYSAGERTLLSQEGWIGHDVGGNLTMSFGASFYSSPWGWNASFDVTASLPTIPRYANIISFSVNKIDETSVKFDWSADAITDYAWYSINNGASWNSMPVNNIITGLSANTSYNFKLRIRRADSQLTTDSGTYTQSTYDYPYVSNIKYSNLIIGQEQVLTLYNPLNRNVTIKMYKDDTSGQELYSGTTSSTTLSFTPNSETLYNSIPNSVSGDCVYSVIYNNSTKTTLQNKYLINEEECKPIFEDFEYEDENSYIQNIVENNQILVDNNSQCRFIVSTTNKAIAKNGASIVNYVFEWNTITTNALYSSEEDVESNDTITSTGNIIKASAIDSRGQTTTVIKNINSISYKNAIVNTLDTERENGVEAKTYLETRLTIWNGNWQNGNNSNYNNTLKYVGYRVFDNNSWTEYKDITQSFLNKASSISSGEKLTYDLSKNDKLEIHANTISGGFEIGKEYLIQILIKDGTTTKTYTPLLYQATLQGNVSDGKIGRGLYKDINGEYHSSVNGMPESDYNEYVYGKFNATEIYQNGVKLNDLINQLIADYINNNRN